MKQLKITNNGSKFLNTRNIMLYHYYMSGDVSQKELAEHFNISRSRVNQIIKKMYRLAKQGVISHEDC